MLEHDVDQKIVQYAKDTYKMIVIKLTMLGMLGIKGMPDRLFLGFGALIFFIEMKATGEELSEHQATRIKQLRDMGFRVYVCDDPTEGKRIVDDEVGHATAKQIVRDARRAVNDAKVARDWQAPRTPTKGR